MGAQFLNKAKKEWRSTFERWEIVHNESKQIDLLREILKMPELNYRQVACIACQKPFKAQFKGDKKITHLCDGSHDI